MRAQSDSSTDTVSADAQTEAPPPQQPLSEEQPTSKTTLTLATSDTGSGKLDALAEIAAKALDGVSEGQQAKLADPGPRASVEAGPSERSQRQSKRDRRRPLKFSEYQSPSDEADEEGSPPRKKRATMGRKKARRERTVWTDEETKTLIRLTMEFGPGNWKRIYEAGEGKFGDRTLGDLKDKWRNLERQGKVPYVERKTRLPSAAAAPALSPAPAAERLPSNPPSETSEGEQE